ncbi:MAG: hypothetical protein IT438_02835 [Phycisphaerales bacterium]|nr:hypothetical protein [Phycisphaerales bacterium]
MKSLVFWGVAPAVLAAVCGSVSSAHADQYSVVARVGASPAGTSLSGGSYYRLCNYSGSEIPIISGSGRIVFESQMQGSGLTASNNIAVFGADRASTGGDSISLLARTGEPFSAGVTISNLSSLQVGSDDRVGFLSSLTGSGVISSNSKAYWSFVRTNRALVAREGTSVDGSMIGAITDLRMETSDLFGTFKATVPGYSGVHAYYNFDSTGLESLARVGENAPGISGATFSTNLRRLSGGTGDSLLYSTLVGSTVSSANNSAIYLGSGDILQLAARTGQATGDIPGASFLSIFTSTAAPAINARGYGAFTASFGGTSSGMGIWRTWSSGTSASRQLMVRTGDSASGIGVTDGATFASVSPAGLAQNLTIANDAANSIALIASLSGPGVDSTNDRSLWLLHSPTSREMVMRGGQHVGGAIIVNESVGSTVRTNANGQVALRAMVVTDPSTQATANAILRYSGGTLSMVACEGQTIAGSTPLYLRSVRWMPGMQFNDLGQIVFVGAVAWDETDPTGRPALMRVDQAGGLAVIAMTGTRVTSTQGADLAFSSLGYSDSASLSNTGDVTFVTTLIGGGSSDHAILRVAIEPSQPTLPERLPGDFNNNGMVSEQDLFDFLNAYFGGSLAADMNQTQSITVDDLFTFLQHYFGSR